MTEGGITAFAIFFLVMMIGGFVFVIWFEIRSNRSEATKRIEAEKKALKSYRKELSKIDTDGPNVRAVESIRIGKSDKAKCPYCGRTFLVSSGTCPSCGATVSVTDDEIVITRSDEHIELLKGMEYRHKENLEELKLQRSKDRRETYTMFLFCVIVLIVLIIVTFK